jgi:pyridoxal phosphate enzyme (YggS family)
MNFSRRIENIRNRITEAAIAAQRPSEAVKLVCVSKTVGVDRIREAAAAGATCMGENYVQEARDKINALAGLDISWHFIGHLQTNKAKYVVRMFDLVHSVGSLRLADELNKQAAKVSKVQRVMVQVNVAGEESKSGVGPEEVATLVTHIDNLQHLSCEGLMTMPPYFDQPERVRPYFRQLRELQAKINDQRGPDQQLRELSMGMTGDFEAAIAEGATLVRIGTAIFGERQ